MSDTAFVLIAHGAREASWALPLRRVADSVVAQAPELRVELAFMELMPPDLAECVEKLVAEGFVRILVVPLFIARGGHIPNYRAGERILTFHVLAYEAEPTLAELKLTQAGQDISSKVQYTLVPESTNLTGLRRYTVTLTAVAAITGAP